jgi:hypothetical protein
MDADVFVVLGRARAQLCQFNDVWHCIGEAMTMVQTTNEVGTKPKLIASPVKSRRKSPEP